MALLGGTEVRQLCQMLDLRPSKNLGQNFVIDPGTVRRIVRQANLGSAEHVLEIGPGLGSLTLALLETAAAVSVVEIDPRLAAALPVTVNSFLPEAPARLRVLYQDGLRLLPEDLLAPPPSGENGPGRETLDSGMERGTVLHRGTDARLELAPSVLVANLPYNVAVPLLLGVLERFPTIERALVMVQEEVADRLAATPGSRVYGVPSVKLAWWGSARKTLKIGTQVFYPVPNVDSALLEFTREPAAWRQAITPGVKSFAAPTEAGGEEQLRAATFAAVDAAFSQRRKSLRQSLAKWAGSAPQAENLLHHVGIDPLTRAENLQVGDFAALAGMKLSTLGELATTGELATPGYPATERAQETAGEKAKGPGLQRAKTGRAREKSQQNQENRQGGGAQ